MAVRFTATDLDLSRFNGFKLIDYTYAQIKAERITSMRARFDAQNIPYDVDVLETDPSVILQEEDAYREALDKQAINDTGLGLTLAFAAGTRLDLIGETYFATSRLTITPADPVSGAAAVMETDERYRRRIQLAPEAFSGGGTPGGYVYSALSSDARVIDANCYIDAPGTGNVFISILEDSEDGTVSDEVYANVRQYVLSESQRLATDNVSIVRAFITLYEVKANIIIPPGVSPGTAVTDATTRFNAEAKARHTIGMPFPREAMAAALHIPSAIRVDITLPFADLDPGPAGALFCVGLTVTTSLFSEWPVSALPVMGPKAVTRQQFLTAITLLGNIDTLIAAIPMNDINSELYIEWTSATIIRSDGPLALKAQEIFIWSDDMLDALFTMAKTL